VTLDGLLLEFSIGGPLGTKLGPTLKMGETSKRQLLACCDGMNRKSRRAHCAVGIFQSKSFLIPCL